jgi:hypothetical protein
MDKETIKERLKKLAINTAILCQELPYNVINKVYINQIIKC